MEDSMDSGKVSGYVVPATPLKPQQPLKFYVRRKKTQDVIDDGYAISSQESRVSSSSDKEELADKCFFPGDCGFVITKESDESEVSQGVPQKEEKETNSEVELEEQCAKSEIPQSAENSQSTAKVEPEQKSPKSQTHQRNTKKPNATPKKQRFHRPRIMEEGKKPRNPATIQMRTIYRKRKKEKDNEDEDMFEPGTPEKQSFPKRKKDEKTTKSNNLSKKPKRTKDEKTTKNNNLSKKPKRTKYEKTKKNVARTLFSTQDFVDISMNFRKKRKTRRARSDFRHLIHPSLMPIWRKQRRSSNRRKNVEKWAKIALFLELLHKTEDTMPLFMTSQHDDNIRSSHAVVSLQIEDAIMKPASYDIIPNNKLLQSKCENQSTEIDGKLFHQKETDLSSSGHFPIKIPPLQTEDTSMRTSISDLSSVTVDSSHIKETIVKSVSLVDQKLQKKRAKDIAVHIIQQIRYQRKHGLSSLADVPLHIEDTMSASDLDVAPEGPIKITKDIAKLIKEMKRLDIKKRVTTLSKNKEKLVTAKVDLDPETIKMWELLMVNDRPSRSEFNEETDPKWGKIREEFQSLINLFISQMHLLQGDRKFQHWKGSVVDSVVGVFLTQNVSDYLSSNAFLSVAAKFPIDTSKGSEGLEYYIEEPLEVNDSLVENQCPELVPDVEDHEKVAQRKNPKTGIMEDERVDWKSLRRKYTKERSREKMHMDIVDWNAATLSGEKVFASIIRKRGQHNELARKILKFLNNEIKENETVDLEWLRDAPSDLVKRYLLEIEGIGLKSAECVRLLGLKHSAFPVDTNVCRIAVRLGWVPLEPLPNGVQMHQLFHYPSPDLIQKYLWPRLCKLPQETLYELHYQMITFGKVFCTKILPNCNACPMQSKCKYFASACASTKNLLRGPEEKTQEPDISVPAHVPDAEVNMAPPVISLIEECSSSEWNDQIDSCESVVELPSSPIAEIPELLDIEDTPCRSPRQPYAEVPDILNIGIDMNAWKKNVERAFIKDGRVMNNFHEEVSKELVVPTLINACIPIEPKKLKYYNRLRTEHVVYELPDDHVLLHNHNFERREPGDPSPYLLAIWQPGEMSWSSTPPKKMCCSDGSNPCKIQTCSFCRNIEELRSNKCRGTILIPCRTAARGGFPLNGTYFQTNEVFADHETSLRPIEFPKHWCDGLKKSALYCGTSVTAIFRFLDTSRIKLCFWTGFLCMRAFDRRTRYPQELVKRLHAPPSKGHMEE